MTREEEEEEEEKDETEMTTTTISGGGGRRASASSPSRIARRECGRSFGITTTPMRWRSQSTTTRRRAK